LLNVKTAILILKKVKLINKKDCVPLVIQKNYWKGGRVRMNKILMELVKQDGCKYKRYQVYCKYSKYISNKFWDEFEKEFNEIDSYGGTVKDILKAHKINRYLCLSKYDKCESKCKPFAASKNKFICEYCKITTLIEED